MKPPLLPPTDPRTPTSPPPAAMMMTLHDPLASVSQSYQGNDDHLVLVCMDCLLEIGAPGTPDTCQATGMRHH